MRTHRFEAFDGASGMVCTALVADEEGHGEDCGLPAGHSVHSKPDSERRYTSVQLAELCGLSFRQIDYWCRRGYLGERLQHENIGNGHYRSFLPEEVTLVRHVAQLSRAGFSPARSVEIFTNYTDPLVNGEHRAVLPASQGGLTIVWRLESP